MTQPTPNPRDSFRLIVSFVTIIGLLGLSFLWFLPSIRGSLLRPSLATCLGQLQSPSRNGWLSNHWVARRQIILDSSTLQRSLYETSVRMTIPVNGALPSIGTGTAFAVTLSDGVTELPYSIAEIRSGRATLNVRIPYLDSHTDTMLLLYSDDVNRLGGASQGLASDQSGEGGDWAKTPEPILEQTLYDADVMYENGTFYLVATNDAMDIELFSSPDGLHFSSRGAIVKNDGSEHQQKYIMDPSMIKVGEEYRMYFQGDDREIFVATASQLTGPWKQRGGVFQLGRSGRWDDTTVNEPSVLYTPDDPKAVWKMTYTGGNGSSEHTGYAFSRDGFTWIRYSQNPVLRSGYACGDAYDAELIHVNGGYVLFYNEKNDHSNIGLATSKDMVRWLDQTASAERIQAELSVGTSGAWDEASIYAPSVIFDGTTYHLYYQGSNKKGVTRIGHAALLEKNQGKRPWYTDFLWPQE